MAKTTKDTDKSKKTRPASTPEARENQVIAAAMKLAEQQILDGTASSQVITHFLKLGSSKHQLEMEKLRKENELLRVKAESIESAKRVEELYIEALNAMRRYRGETIPDDEDYYDEYDEDI